jgi:hypothetical protein
MEGICCELVQATYSFLGVTWNTRRSSIRILCLQARIWSGEWNMAALHRYSYSVPCSRYCSIFLNISNPRCRNQARFVTLVDLYRRNCLMYSVVLNIYNKTDILHRLYSRSVDLTSSYWYYFPTSVGQRPMTIIRLWERYSEDSIFIFISFMRFKSSFLVLYAHSYPCWPCIKIVPSVFPVFHPSVRPFVRSSLRMKQLESRWTEFDKI